MRHTWRTPGRGSLFERLVPDAPPRRTLSHRDQVLERIHAVTRHLAWMLNARQGCSASSPGLGLSDFNGLSMDSGDLLAQISADIRASIQAFEPRITVRGVRQLPNETPLNLSFRLDCALHATDPEERIELDILMNGRDRSLQVQAHAT